MVYFLKFCTSENVFFPPHSWRISLLFIEILGFASECTLFNFYLSFQVYKEISDNPLIVLCKYFHVCSVTLLCPTLQPHGLVAEQTPLSMGFTSKNIGMDFHFLLQGASLVAQRLKRLPPMWQTRVRSLGQEDPLEKEMVTHSSILAWRIPWTEPGSLQGRKESDRTERLHSLTHSQTNK